MMESTIEAMRDNKNVSKWGVVSRTILGVIHMRRKKDTEDMHDIVMKPGTEVRSRWLYIVLFVASYNIFSIPFQIAFRFDEKVSIFLFLITVLLDTLFVIDIVVNFHLAFMEQGLLITSLDQIASRYKKGKFTFDVITILPIDYILWLFVTRDTKWIFATRLNRLLRIYSMNAWFNEVFPISDAPARLIRLSFVLASLMHIGSCLYFSFTIFEVQSASQVSFLFSL